MATGSNHIYTPLFRTNQNAAVSALSPNYSDVFGRLDGGGVPVLKLPVNHQNGEKELPFDLGLVDYDEVFGGYHDWSFAASYEDVFGISSGGEMLEEEEACWTHLEDASSLEKPYHFTQYAQSNILSSENGDQSLDINRRLCVLDRIIPSESKGDTVNLETGLKNSLMERSDTDSIRCGRKSQNVSQSNGAFRTISGINLRTHPSRCPPPSRNPPLLYVQNEDLKCLRTQSRGSRSRSYSFQGTVSSPTFHDVEVDASSSAAASAAAMLDAMEKAQAKLNSAKEMMQQTYHLKQGQKTSVKQSFIDGSRKSKENLVQKVKVATEGRKSFACDGVQNLTNDAEMVSQSRGEMNQNSIDHKFVVKRRRQGSWSCRDSEKCVSINGAADSSDLFDMELAGKQLLEVENKKEMASESACMQKEHMKYEMDLSSANDQKTTKTQLAEADSWNKRDISTGVLQEANTVNVYVEVEKEGIVTKRKPTDGRTSNKCDVSEHWQMKTEADITEQCDQGLERKTFELAEFGSELKEEACGREQSFKGLSLTCDPEENEESLKQSYEFNVGMERSETLSKRQNSEQFTVAREVRESKKLQSDVYTTTMSASHAKPYLSEEHFMDGRAEIVKPLGLLYEQTENRSVENSRVSPGCVKLDLNVGDIGHEYEEDIKIRPGFDEDIFEENHVAQDESLCEKIMEVVENDIRALHLGENNRNSVAAATGMYAAQEVLIQSHVFSESNDHEEMVTEFGEEVVLCNKEQVPVSGLMTSDPQKLPKMVDLEVQHLPKSRPTSENSCSFQQHHRSDEAVNISMLGKNEKMLHEQLKKLEKERNMEREKDNLVVERALHEVHEKARNDVEKAAVERGPTECQQNAVGDSVKPQELQADSPQRCKARLERQRRTAERAARALAEKNMCDLAAEREQAERNRLADSLGAEVKRWATGKEGNLRALLSTLQYILGPDSGWKPIPLTEVITPVAVKKAYRKATLYVHPDKVQQRGANVHQKFICEKVFDLIKDAWNKFNSDA